MNVIDWSTVELVGGPLDGVTFCGAEAAKFRPGPHHYTIDGASYRPRTPENGVLRMDHAPQRNSP